MRTLTPTLAVLSMAAAAQAQCPPSLSFLAGAPSALSLADDAGVPFDRTRVYVHEAGFHTRAPAAAAPTPRGIHFDIRAAMIACGAAAPPDIDALSLGQDFLLVDDATGEIDVPANQWAVLDFSVSKTSTGEAGSVIRTEAGSPDGPGADVFTYVLPGSALPAELVDRTTRAQDSREIDLGSGAQREVDALDQFIPLYGLDPGLTALLPPRPVVLFSVSGATVGQVPPTWWGGTTPSAATVLQMIWSPTTGGWSCPRLFKSYADLGLAAHEDLDALAVDLPRQRIVFSTKTPSRDELLFVYCGTDGAAAPKTLTEKGTGDKIEDKIRLLDSDDVDGVCGIDPSVRSTPNGTPNVWYYFAGTPLPKLLPPAGTAQASAFRVPGPTGPRIRSMLVGWPPATGVGPGYAICLFSPPNQFGPFVPLLGEQRDVTPVFCGDPRVMTIGIPLGLVNFEFDLRWFLADQAVTEIDDVHPLRIRL